MWASFLTLHNLGLIINCLLLFMPMVYKTILSVHLLMTAWFFSLIAGRFAARDLRQTVAVGVVKSVERKLNNLARKQAQKPILVQ